MKISVELKMPMMPNHLRIVTATEEKESLIDVGTMDEATLNAFIAEWGKAFRAHVRRRAEALEQARRIVREQR